MAADENDEHRNRSLAFGIGIGVALGAGIGVALGNIGVGIAIGIALGAALGSSIRLGGDDGTRESKGDDSDGV
jgi:hypothetical protein